jgi:hypothetical protein
MILNNRRARAALRIKAEQFLETNFMKSLRQNIALGQMTPSTIARLR